MSGGSRNGTTYGYSVEARESGNSPREVNGQLLDKEWRNVSFNASISGVPSPSHEFGLTELGLFGYTQAQALRWWFHANADQHFAGLCVETRIVKHSVKYSIESTRLSDHLVVGGEDRSSVMPDWGQPVQK